MVIYFLNIRVIVENCCIYLSLCMDWLLQENIGSRHCWSVCIKRGLKQSKACPCFFWKTWTDGAVNKLLDYVDDMMYFGTKESGLKDFWDNLCMCDFLGQAHWYLSTQIAQDNFFNITVDQSRYWWSVIHHFLDTAGDKRVPRHPSCPLPAAFQFHSQCLLKLTSYTKSLDFVSCIGALIYLS